MNNTTTRYRIGFRYRSMLRHLRQQGRTDFCQVVFIHPNRHFPHGSSRILSGQMPLLVEAEIELSICVQYPGTITPSSFFHRPLERFAGQPDGTGSPSAGLQRVDYGRKRQTPSSPVSFAFGETLHYRCHSQTRERTCVPTLPGAKELFRPVAQTKGFPKRTSRGC